MRFNSTVIGRLREFACNNSGSFTVLTGAIMAVIVLSAGYAVNIAQLYNVRSSLGHALDAAVTSTARDITIGRIEPDDARDMGRTFPQGEWRPDLHGRRPACSG